MPAEEAMTEMTAAEMPACRAVLFDLDGTLLDSELVSAKAVDRATRACGKAFTRALHKRILGRPRAEWTQMVVDDLALHDQLSPRALGIAWENNLLELVHETEEMPGALALVRWLHEHHVPIALATSAPAPVVAQKRMSHAELFSYFSVIVCGDDRAVKRGKPAPDIFLTAGERLLGGEDGERWNPVHCLVFEDSAQGVQAGVAAGMRVLAVPDARFYPTLEEQQQLFHAATEILPSLTAFNPSKYGLGE